MPVAWSPTRTGRESSARKSARQGFYVSHGERDPETKAVAVPVLGPDGNLGRLARRHGTPEPLRQTSFKHIVGILTAKAQALSRMLSGR